MNPPTWLYIIPILNLIVVFFIITKGFKGGFLSKVLMTFFLIGNIIIAFLIIIIMNQ